MIFVDVFLLKHYFPCGTTLQLAHFIIAGFYYQGCCALHCLCDK